MDIFRSKFYRVNVILLSALGLWPYRKSKSWNLFQQINSQFMLVSLTIVLTIKLYEIWGDFDIMIECFTPLGVNLAAVIKFSNSLFHRKKTMQLLETIKSDWSSLRNKKEIEILTKYANEGRILTIIYMVLMSCATFMYLMIPLLPRVLDIVVPLNESRAIVHLYHAEYYVDPDENFLWILLHSYTATIFVISTVVAADSIFACCVLHVCGILAVIGYRLENLTPKHSNTNVGDCIMSKEDDSRCYREIVLCIDQHYKATEVANVIESSNSVSYLLVFGIAMVILSLSGVQLLIKFGQVEEMVRLATFNVGQCTHLLFNSWPCQKLIDESIKLRESLYAAEWYSLSEGNKNLLKFAMLRTLEPQQITAGKLYVMSIESFGLVMQKSVSYFTVFASVR